MLIETALRWAELTGTERVLDLFCGNGNFSLPFARYCAEVVGYEDYALSIEDAVTNSRRNKMGNTSFFCKDSASGVRELVRRVKLLTSCFLTRRERVPWKPYD